MSDKDKEEKSESSSEEYGNPALPDELLKMNGDYLIGNTVISKQKVLSTLLKLFEEAKRKMTSDEAERKVEELDEEFENELCNLWDISVDNDVCQVLDELKAIEIFDQYMAVMHGVYPRAIEILVGILGNMASLDARICEKVLLNQSLMKFCTDVLFYDLSDTKTLVQLLRLFNLFIQNESFQKQFINSKLNVDEDFIKFSSFVLDQSLNHELLDAIIEFLINVFDADEQILRKFAEDANFTCSLLTSIRTRILKTAGDDDDDSEQEADLNICDFDSTLKSYFICLQLLSTCENGVTQLCLINKSLLEIFDMYTEKFLDFFNNERNSFDAAIYFRTDLFIRNFVCFYSVFNVVLVNTWPQYKNLNSNDSLFTLLNKLIKSLTKVSTCFIKKLSTLQRDDLDDAKHFKLAFNCIEEFIKFDDVHEVDAQNIRNLAERAGEFKSRKPGILDI